MKQKGREDKKQKTALFNKKLSGMMNDGNCIWTR